MIISVNVPNVVRLILFTNKKWLEGDNVMKKVVGGWIGSIVGFLVGGFLLCFPQIVPFAITLMVISGVLFISLGVLALFLKYDY